MKKDFQLYVGTLWHQFCDPFVCVVGTTKQAVQEALDKAAEEEYAAMCDDLDESEEPPEDTIMGSPYGPTLESVREILRSLPKGESYLLREALENGYSYLPI